MDIRMDEGPFAKTAQGISKIFHVLLKMKFLQTKPQIKNMKINCFELKYTVIKNRDGIKIVIDEYENEYNNFKDFIPNHYIGNKMIKKN